MWHVKQNPRGAPLTTAPLLVVWRGSPLFAGYGTQSCGRASRVVVSAGANKPVQLLIVAKPDNRRKKTPTADASGALGSAESISSEFDELTAQPPGRNSGRRHAPTTPQDVPTGTNARRTVQRRPDSHPDDPSARDLAPATAYPPGPLPRSPSHEGLFAASGPGNGAVGPAPSPHAAERQAPTRGDMGGRRGFVEDGARRSTSPEVCPRRSAAFECGVAPVWDARAASVSNAGDATPAWRGRQLQGEEDSRRPAAPHHSPDRPKSWHRPRLPLQHGEPEPAGRGSSTANEQRNLSRPSEPAGGWQQQQQSQSALHAVAPLAAPSAHAPPPPLPLGLEPPAGSVMSGWGMAGGQPRMNSVYRLIRKKELQQSHLRHYQRPGGEAGGGAGGGGGGSQQAPGRPPHRYQSPGHEPSPGWQRPFATGDPSQAASPPCNGSGGGDGGDGGGSSSTFVGVGMRTRIPGGPRHGPQTARSPWQPEQQPQADRQQQTVSTPALGPSPDGALPQSTLPSVPGAALPNPTAQPHSRPPPPPRTLLPTGHAAVDRVVRIREIQMRRTGRLPAGEGPGLRRLAGARGSVGGEGSGWADGCSSSDGGSGRSSGDRFGGSNSNHRGPQQASGPNPGASYTPAQAGRVAVGSWEPPPGRDGQEKAKSRDGCTAAAGPGSGHEDSFSGGAGLIEVSYGQDPSGSLDAGGYFQDAERPREVGAGGGDSEGLLRQALMSEMSRMNPVYRLIRKHELQRRHRGTSGGGSGSSASSAGAKAAAGTTGGWSDPWVGHDFADVMLRGLMLPPTPPAPSPAALPAGPAAGTSCRRHGPGGAPGADADAETTSSGDAVATAVREGRLPGGLGEEQAGSAGGSSSGLSSEDGDGLEDAMGSGGGSEGGGRAGRLGSGLNPVMRLIRKKQLQRQLWLRGRIAPEAPTGRGARTGADGEGFASRSGGDANGTAVDEAPGSPTSDESAADAADYDSDWEISPADAVGGRALMNPVYRLIRKKVLLTRQAKKTAAAAAGAAAIPPASDTAPPPHPQPPQLSKPAAGSAPFFNLEPFPGREQRSPDPDLDLNRKVLYPKTARVTNRSGDVDSLNLQQRPQSQSQSQSQSQDNVWDTLPEIELPVDAREGPQPSASQQPLPPRQARPLVSDGLAGSLVGERPHMDPVYRLVRKQELQLRHRTPPPPPPPQQQQLEQEQQQQHQSEHQSEQQLEPRQRQQRWGKTSSNDVYDAYSSDDEDVTKVAAAGADANGSQGKSRNGPRTTRRQAPKQHPEEQQQQQPAALSETQADTAASRGGPEAAEGSLRAGRGTRLSSKRHRQTVLDTGEPEGATLQPTAPQSSRGAGLGRFLHDTALGGVGAAVAGTGGNGSDGDGEGGGGGQQQQQPQGVRQFSGIGQLWRSVDVPEDGTGAAAPPPPPAAPRSGPVEESMAVSDAALAVVVEEVGAVVDTPERVAAVVKGRRGRPRKSTS